jgi:hypothetical protein
VAPPLARTVALLALLAPSAAHAQLGGRRGGFWGDLGGGLAVADRPWTPGAGWTVAMGGWFGKYDDSFAIGRRVDVGVRVTQQLVRPDTGVDRDWILRSAPMLEARRGIDLLVVALRFGGAVGPLVNRDLHGPADLELGATIRANGAVGWRFVPRASLMLRLEAGIDVIGRHVDPVLGLTVGLEVALPGKRRTSAAGGG